jgi:MFS family permease
MTTPFRILCTTGFFAIFSATIAKSPVLPLFAMHLGGNPSQVGVVAAMSAFTGVVVSIPAGIMADRFGKRRMLLISSIIFVSAPVSYLLITEIWQLAIVRFYHGLATAIFTPISMALVSELFHKERGEKLGWFSTATLFGRFSAPVIGGGIISAMVLYGSLQFSAVYVVCSVAGIITFLLSFRIPRDSEQHSAGKSWKDSWETFKSVITSRAIIITSAVEAAILFLYGTFETFLPLYALKSGFTASHVGLFLSAQIITLALTKPSMGRFSDRHGRKPQIFLGGLIGAVCIALLAFVQGFVWFLAVSILIGLSLSVVTSATSALIADLSKSEGRGSAMGILGSIMDIGHTTGPIVAGIVAATYGFEKAFLTAAALLATMSLIFLMHAGRSALYDFRQG